MDFLEYKLWCPNPHETLRNAVNDLWANIGRNRRSTAFQTKLLDLIQQENEELRLRVGVLIRLLIQQGVITADQYAAAVNQAKENLALAKAQATKERQNKSRSGKALPKPPKLNLSKLKTAPSPSPIQASKVERKKS